MIAGWLLEQSINGPDLVDSCVGTTGPTAMVAVVVGPMGTTAGDVGCCGSDRIASALWCYGASAEVIPPSCDNTCIWVPIPGYQSQHHCGWVVLRYWIELF